MKKQLLNKKASDLIAGAFILTAALFTSCNKINNNSNNTNSGSAPTTMKVTDAPVYDSCGCIEAAVVTIADIQLDGKSIEGFHRTSIDLVNYKNGNIMNLGTYNLKAATYSNITFVLDYNRDEWGGVPGTYYIGTDSIKHKLQSTTSSITLSKNFVLHDSTTNSFIFDFDLRKMMNYAQGDSTRWVFVSDSALRHSIRVIYGSQYSSIGGTLTNNISADSDKVISYAYTKGSFDSSKENHGEVQYLNAVTSSEVDQAGHYKFYFLDSGVYEIHFASYKKNEPGIYSYRGLLYTNASGGVDIFSIPLGLSDNLTVDATATGWY
jgi:hypothetical protein